MGGTAGKHWALKDGCKHLVVPGCQALQAQMRGVRNPKDGVPHSPAHREHGDDQQPSGSSGAGLLGNSELESPGFKGDGGGGLAGAGASDSIWPSEDAPSSSSAATAGPPFSSSNSKDCPKQALNRFLVQL